MSGYLRWLAWRFDDLERELPEHQSAYGDKARKELHGVHARTPGIMASLFTGLLQFLDFAKEVGCLSVGEANKYIGEGWEALIEACESQARHLGSEDVVNPFLRLLTAAVNCGGAHLANTKDNGKPEMAESWGWRYDDHGKT